MINVLILSRNQKDRNTIFNILNNQNDIQIIGVEKDETDAIMKTEKSHPDVVILDLTPPGIDSIELAPLILRRSPSTVIIMVSGRDENEYAVKAIKTGIAGYLLRENDMDKLLSTVRIASLGGIYINTSIITRLINNIDFQNKFPGQVKNRISRRNNFFTSAEQGIIGEMAKGFSDDEIAKNLNFSTGTVRNYVAAVKRRTKLKNRIQLVLFSLINGLIDMEQIGLLNINNGLNEENILQ